MVDDMGFRRHIPSEQVDRVVLGEIAGMMKGSEGYISEQTAKMLGQDDIFTKAMLERQLKDIDKQFDMWLNGRGYTACAGLSARKENTPEAWIK